MAKRMITIDKFDKSPYMSSMATPIPVRDRTKPRKYLSVTIPLLAVLATVFACFAGCVSDPEWVFRVSEGEIQFSKQDYFRQNSLFDYRVILPNDLGELFLYGYTESLEGSNQDYYVTLRIMVHWNGSTSKPVYYPSNVQIRIGGIPMAVENVYKKKYTGPTVEGRLQYERQYIRIRSSCDLDSLREVAASRGLIDAQIIKIDLNELMMIDGKYVPIDPIYAQDSREVSTISEKKQ